ncbi:RN169 ligase, partial [Nothoprocta pentlandii]|nr:RN169 ligase [Nothoprocta pentlandii]
QLREEKLQEEKASEELIHKLLLDDMEGGKRKMEEQQKKDESLVLKVNQECFPERLSDSENEEPFQGKQAHRSAFVSKTSAYSFAFLSGNLTSKVERSRSCNDTIQERSKSRQRSAPANKAKVAAVPSASTPLLGVLSCTQNNRCLSAPDLSAEKRLALTAASSSSALHKPERSISPESNDSISEELNHFKPIVCSPCTPPKRLPDGRVLSPLIIKSTPRNLSRSLQKPTSYEASPRILKKWEQIFQERQIKKTLSKATLTSAASEPGDDVPAPATTNPGSCVKEQPEEPVPPRTTGAPRPELDFYPSMSETKPGTGGERSRAPQALTTADNSAEAAARAKVNARLSGAAEGKASAYAAKPCLKMPSRSGPVGADPVRAPGKKQLQFLPPGELLPVRNSSGGGGGEKLAGEQPPAPRRGRKRRCKTKHLEHKGPLKRLRPAAAGDAASAPTAAQRRLRQEEEDRRLALRLQRLFDSENRTVERRRARGERYLLRSKSTLGAK